MPKINQERLDAQSLCASVHCRSLHLKRSCKVYELSECACVKSAEREGIDDFAGDVLLKKIRIVVMKLKSDFYRTFHSKFQLIL
jgi:hypothetical protein